MMSYVHYFPQILNAIFLVQVVYKPPNHLSCVNTFIFLLYNNLQNFFS